MVIPAGTKALMTEDVTTRCWKPDRRLAIPGFTMRCPRGQPNLAKGQLVPEGLDVQVTDYHGKKDGRH